MVDSLIRKADRMGQQWLGKNLWRFIKLILKHVIAFLVVFGAMKVIKLFIGEEPPSYPLAFVFQFGEWTVGFLFILWTVLDVISEIRRSIREVNPPKRRRRKSDGN